MQTYKCQQSTRNVVHSIVDGFCDHCIRSTRNGTFCCVVCNIEVGDPAVHFTAHHRVESTATQDLLWCLKCRTSVAPSHTQWNYCRYVAYAENAAIALY